MSNTSFPNWDALGRPRPSLAEEFRSALGQPVVGRPLEDEVMSDASGVSVGSHIRRARIEAERMERRRRFEEDERRREQEEDEELEHADMQSALGTGEAKPALTSGPRSEAEVKEETEETIRRRLRSLAATEAAIAHERATLVRSLARGVIGGGLVSSDSESDDVYPTSSTKAKVTPPRPWKGSFVHSELEAWIRSADGYLESINIRPKTKLSTRLVVTILRDLMSPDAPPGGVSPQRWFDLTHDQKHWERVRDVFVAIRGHWVDDRAADRTVAAFRAAKQGTDMARSFGARVQDLATACVDRNFSDDDKKEVFLNGLVPDTRAYVDLEVRRRKREGKVTDFETMIAIAADRDSVSFHSASISALTPARKPASTPTTLSTSSSPTTTRSSFSPAPIRDRSTHPWVARATKWQAEYAVADKADWFFSQTRPVDPALRCFNCGKCAGHLSRACPSVRVPPTSVHIAAVKMSPSSPLTVISEIAEGSGKEDGK
jgi:hypothetical protein